VLEVESVLAGHGDCGVIGSVAGGEEGDGGHV